MFKFPDSYVEDQGWSISTRESYEAALKEFLLHAADRDTISAEEIKQFKSRLQSHSNRNATIKLKLAAIREYCRFKQLREIKSLFAGIKYRRNEECADTAPKITESMYHSLRARLFKKNKLRSALLVDLLYWTGARVSDILRLKLSDFDFEKKRIKFKQKKTGLPYETFIAKEIGESLNKYTREKYITGSLFEGVSRSAVDKMLRYYLKRLKFPVQSAHKFRHNRITQWSKKYPLQLVRVQSGHKSIETLKHYMHLTLDDVAQYDASHQELTAGV